MSLLPLLLALAAAPEIDFDTQVVPVLTKAGCNTGACHGAAVGQGGFALSLWGSDPSADYRAIVRQFEGRRVNLARPEESLLVSKPTGTLEHGGGVRLEFDSADAALLVDWVRGGARRPLLRRLERFAIVPAAIRVGRVGDVAPLRAGAAFDSGPPQDVTPWTVFAADDPSAVEIDDAGRARVLRRGRHTVIARYLDRVVAVEVTLPLADEPLDLSALPRINFIDDEVLATLQSLGLPPAGSCDDATFLRRAALDLIGTLPSPETARAFVADDSPDKRERLIDSLLDGDDFARYWTLFYTRLLKLDSRRMEGAGAEALHAWLTEQVRENRPWNEMARELLTAEGDSYAIGPANFARAAPNAREQAEHVSQLFLGVRLRCANCHNHPLDRWTQDDYHGLAAVFARLERGRQVHWGPRGEVIHPRSGEATLPRLPGERFLDQGDRRGELAAWTVAADNPYFARAMVNRLWKALFGRGLVEPVDDLRATNPGTHPELLERLAEDFVAHGYDVRHTLRRIASSATYHRGAGSQPASAADIWAERYYAVAPSRPLSAEVLADAFAAVTGADVIGGGSDVPRRAIDLVDAAAESPPLEILGRCGRDEPCDAGATETGLARTLHLINGPLLNAAIASPEGRLARLLADRNTDDAIVEELYLRALGRLPGEAERTLFGCQFRGDETPTERRQLWEDILWSLLTCREFATNH